MNNNICVANAICEHRTANGLFIERHADSHVHMSQNVMFFVFLITKRAIEYSMVQSSSNSQSVSHAAKNDEQCHAMSMNIEYID